MCQPNCKWKEKIIEDEKEIEVCVWNGETESEIIENGTKCFLESVEEIVKEI